MSFEALQIQLFSGLFSSVCEEMGHILQHAAFSPNIKERRDFSCALFDDKGELVAQAAHVPVHLGSAQVSVKEAMKAFKLKPGDMVILNDPYHGGTHLPDFTVIAPVFDPGDVKSSQPLFYLANRAHHADVGGIAAGSLPLAVHIDQEGLRLPPTLLVHSHRLNEAVVERITQASRTPTERLGDLHAQIAANKFGQQRLSEWCGRYSGKTLKKQSRDLISYAETLMKRSLEQFPHGLFRYEDYVELPEANPQDADPSHHLAKIAVQIAVTQHGVTVDFSGSGPQNASSLNTVLAVVQACVLYVFRALSPTDMPVNSGCLRPIKLICPEGCLLNAKFPAAVSAGSVETAQRIVDVLLGALAKALPERIPAASQGTMNNLCIGGKREGSGEPFSYYETIAGGQGASHEKPGADAVHTHMTNTLNTPVETLEHAYPFMIQRYALRDNSGGNGKQSGGRGIERAYEFLQDAEVTLISDRRLYPPYGLSGGGDGATGENTALQDGVEVRMPGKFHAFFKRGDRLRILTPGGGGFGTPEKP